MHGVSEGVLVWRLGLHRFLTRPYPRMDDPGNNSFLREHVHSLSEPDDIDVPGRKCLKFNIQKKSYKEYQNFRIHYPT